MQTLRQEHEKKQKYGRKKLLPGKIGKDVSWEEKRWSVNRDGPCLNEATGAPFSGEDDHYKRGRYSARETTTQPKASLITL